MHTLEFTESIKRTKEQLKGINDFFANVLLDIDDVCSFNTVLEMGKLPELTKENVIYHPEETDKPIAAYIWSDTTRYFPKKIIVNENFVKECFEGDWNNTPTPFEMLSQILYQIVIPYIYMTY